MGTSGIRTPVNSYADLEYGHGVVVSFMKPSGEHGKENWALETWTQSVEDRSNLFRLMFQRLGLIIDTIIRPCTLSNSHRRYTRDKRLV
jgi:hypothetical protein